MSEFNYKFDSYACKNCGGKCCTGESGYIWIKPEEIVKLASYFGITFDEFVRGFTIKFGVKFSLKERVYEDGFCCIFFDTNSKKCQIYDLRPLQCKTFPFWDYYKDKVEELKSQCPGIEVKS